MCYREKQIKQVKRGYEMLNLGKAIRKGLTENFCGSKKAGCVVILGKIILGRGKETQWPCIGNMPGGFERYHGSQWELEQWEQE